MTLARSAARPRRQNSHRADAEKRCPNYLKWLRGRSCFVIGRGHHECRGDIRACHVNHGGDQGMGTKASDKFAIPMCDGAHEEQHRIGWTSFEGLYRFNAVVVAGEMWRHWLGKTEMGRVWSKRQTEANDG